MVITKDFNFSPNHYFGLIKARFLAPKDLWLPVSPVKGEKLIFTLCQKCAEFFTAPPCPHSDAERGFVGTYDSEEVYLTMDYGYKLVEIYEVWNFPEKFV